MKHPLRDGLPVSPYELDLRPTSLELRKRSNLNNHHWLYNSSTVGRLVLSKTVMNLERFQSVLPKDSHQDLHRRFQPPYAGPTDFTDVVLRSMMMVVDEAYHSGQLLRFGSAFEPFYASIDEITMKRCRRDYNDFVDPSVSIHFRS